MGVYKNNQQGSKEMQTRTYEPHYSLGIWHVIDTRTSIYATKGYKGRTAQVFVNHLADGLNAGNKSIEQRFLKGDTTWLSGFDNLEYDRWPDKSTKD